MDLWVCFGISVLSLRVNVPKYRDIFSERGVVPFGHGKEIFHFTA